LPLTLINFNPLTGFYKKYLYNLHRVANCNTVIRNIFGNNRICVDYAMLPNRYALRISRSQSM